MFDSVTQGFSNLFEGIGDILSWLGSFFVNLGKSLMSGFQWFYDTLLKPMFDFIGGLISSILDLLGTVVDFVLDFFNSLWDFFVDLFKTLFVPSSNYFGDKVDSLTSNISSKVGVDVSTLESLKGVASRQTRAPIMFIYDFKLFGYNLHLDLNFIKNVQPYSQALFMGLASIFLCWYNYKNVVRLFGKNTIEGIGSQGGSKE